MSRQTQVNSFFTPTQISGCGLWLDGRDPNATGIQPGAGTSISTWRDKSQAAANGISVGTAPTFVSGGGLLFAINGAYNTSYSASLTNESLFVVFRYTRANASQGLVAQTGNGGRTLMANAGASTASLESSVYNVAFGAVSPSTTMPANTTGIAELVTTNSTMAIFYNGTSFGTPTAVTITAGRTSVVGGAYNAGAPNATQYLGGSIFEVVGYTIVLTTSQRQQVEGYLAWKWGLQGSLPANHPYKSSPIAPLLNPPTTLPVVLQNTQATFSPTQVSGCQLWLDAADPNGNGVQPANGSSVSSWVDKSGNGKTATSSSPPIFSASSLNSLGTIRFNGVAGTAFFLDIPAFDFGTSQRTAFFVIQNTGSASGATSGPVWFWPNTGNGTNALSMTNWMLIRNQGTTININVSANRNQYYIISYRFGSTSGFEELFFYGSSVGTYTKSIGGASYANATAGYRLGWLNNNDLNTEYYYNGNMGEVILFNRAITTAQRQQIEGYLAWKWGLQANLPANHPYKLGPPYSTTITAPSRSLVLATSWQPNQVSGISLWLDAADTSTITLSGTNVSQWNDKSGNGYNLSQANASLQPAFVSNQLNGFGGVQPSSGKYLALVGTSMPNFAYGNQTSVFCVARNGPNNSDWNIFATMFFTTIPSQTTKSRWHLSFNQGAIAGFTLVFTNNPQTVYQNTSFVTQPSASAILGFTGSSSETVLAYNGLTSTYAGRTLLNADDGIVMAIADPRSGAPVAATIFEFIGFNRAITTAQRQQVEGYLAWKWGLVANLPATHPYKLWPPSP